MTWVWVAKRKQRTASKCRFTSRLRICLSRSANWFLRAWISAVAGFNLGSRARITYKKRGGGDFAICLTGETKIRWTSFYLSFYSHRELSPGTFCISLPLPSYRHLSFSERPSVHPPLRLQSLKKKNKSFPSVTFWCFAFFIVAETWKESFGCSDCVIQTKSKWSQTSHLHVWVLSGWRSSSSSFFFMISSWASFSWTLRTQKFSYSSLYWRAKIVILKSWLIIPTYMCASSFRFKFDWRRNYILSSIKFNLTLKPPAVKIQQWH